jgi:hypothetical protein
LVVYALVRDGGASALLPHALHVKPGVFSVAGFREFQQKAASALSAAFVRKG